MSEQEVASSVAQRIIIKFLTKEGVKPSEILTRLKAQFGDATLSRTQVFDWASKFTSLRVDEKVWKMKVMIDVQGQVSQMKTSVQFVTLSKVTGG